MSDDVAQKAQEAIVKAEKVERLVRHEGWPILMETVKGLIAREVQALANKQPLDHSYYRRLGFLQVMKWFEEMPNLIKDKKIREFLMHQGRASGFQRFIEMPQFFFEGRSIGKQVLDRLLGGKPLTQEEIKTFHEKEFKKG